MITAQGVSIWELLFGFVLGLVGSYLLFLLEQRRTREKLIYARSVKSRFDAVQLDKSLREKISVSYEYNPIKSVTMFSLKVANVS